MGSRTVFASRLQKLRKSVEKEGLDGVILAPGPNIRYYTGVQSQILERPFIFFLPKEGEPQLVLPSLESGPYARSPLKVRVHAWDDAGGPSAAFAELSEEVDLKGRWGCEGRVPYGYLRHLEGRKLSLEPADPLLEAIRERKDPAELELVRKAANILGTACMKVPELMRAGMSEVQLATALKEEVFGLGAESVDFCSVQAGAHAADPHWAPSAAKLKNGEGVLIDCVCTFSGYNADITRTFLIGKNREFETAYEHVLEAQREGVRKVRPGVKVGEVDDAARSVLGRYGMGKYFYHRTGHGLGLDVHERPYIVPEGKERLRPGMVFTVEPGVYLEGRYGVRIEDDVIVTQRGVEVTTGLVPKDFGWWK